MNDFPVLISFVFAVCLHLHQFSLLTLLFTVMLLYCVTGMRGWKGVRCWRIKSKFISVNSITGNEHNSSELAYYYSSFYRCFWIDHIEKKRNGEHPTSISFVFRTRRRRFSRPTLEEIAETLLNVPCCPRCERSHTQASAALILRWWRSQRHIRNTSRPKGRERVWESCTRSECLVSAKSKQDLRDLYVQKWYSEPRRVTWLLLHKAQTSG